jgi:agmatine deiminase
MTRGCATAGPSTSTTTPGGAPRFIPASTPGGEKFPPWDSDARVGALIAQRLGDPVVEAPLVLKGGSILTDGAGTLLTTDDCLLNPNRNPTLTRQEIDAALRRHLGVGRFVWLGHGLVEDRDADGLVDLTATLTPGGPVLLQMVPPENPNHEHCRENAARLQRAGLEVIELPYLP